MKILFLGDASNLHNCLAHELRAMGHEAVVVSNGSRWMDTARDIDLSRKPGKLGGAAYAARVLRLLPKLRGWDVVQLVSPIFLELRPQLVRLVFDHLRRHNRLVALSALGTDHTYWRACNDGGRTYRYSDYLVGDQPSPFALSEEFKLKHQANWGKPFMAKHNQHILEHIDGVIACLWEYHEAYRTLQPQLPLTYGGIPIDVAGIEPRILQQVPAKVRFFIGIQRDRTVLKGTNRMLAALRQLRDSHPSEVEVEAVENVPLAEYLQRMRNSHVLLDQLYSYTPATNALQAMAMGLVAVSGAEPEFYRLLGERQLHPIVNVRPTPEGDIMEKLEWIVANKHLLPQLSRDSRQFVEKHNAAPIVAQRHIDFWQQLSQARNS